ncbi:FMN-binding protein [Sedimentibacter sp. MB31-C6]|uniref:FMN-binding protein n=1 Tax=Sedimentibacter sp. MB31-C6 TaxID=3109366 RepID=UPI002DDC98B0|nr:FMN-binding protein [Sedimentibacter sp. MB36-C1]WSI04745.1 FMN-binding protein [Sedimentibacter sp. MB36-C1]
MKKLSLLLCILLCISMVACAEDDNAGDVGDVGDNGGDIVDEAGDDIEDVGDDIEENLDDDIIDDGTDNEDSETLTGSAQGYGGEVTVTVVVNGEDIVSVDAVGEDETEGVGTLALEELPDKIVEADSTDVDSVSGATMTSNAIKEAVNKALDQR